MTSRPAWIDSHCHLEMLKEDVDAALEKSYLAGMTSCISIGTSPDSNQKIIGFCKAYNTVFGTLGLHPHQASNFDPHYLDWIRQEVEINPKIVGIGECGFDLFYEYSAREVQKEAFAAQLNLALDLDLPVVIHSRDADPLTRDMLEPFRGKGLRGVVHSITSEVDQARYLLDFGFYLSFNGICTFPGGESVRDVLKFSPSDRVLLETDAPFLSPVPKRGKPNIPGNVAVVGEFVADFLGMSPSELSRQVTHNTQMLFTGMKHEN